MTFYHICENCSQPVLEKGQKLCAKCKIALSKNIKPVVKLTTSKEKKTMAKKTVTLKSQINDELLEAMSEHNGQLLVPNTLDVSQMLHLIDIAPSETEGMSIATMRPEGWEYLGMETPVSTVNESVSEESEDDFVIESNIPLEPRKAPSNGKKGMSCPYPFSRLEVGQSFLIPSKGAKDDELTKFCLRVANWASRWNQENSVETGQTKISHKGNIVPVRVAIKKIETRRVEGGVRVWRTK